MPLPGTRPTYQAGSLMKLFDCSPIGILRFAQRLPSTLGVCVILVDSLYPYAGGFGRLHKMDSHPGRRDQMAWQRVIHEQDSHGGLITGDPGVHSLMQAVDQQAHGPKLVQQLERTVRWFGNAV